MQAHSDTRIPYGFAHYQQDLDAKAGSGSERLGLDLEKMLQHTLRGSPRHRTNDASSALLDPHLPLIVFNPFGFQREMQRLGCEQQPPNLNKRIIAIHADSVSTMEGYNPEHAASILFDFPFSSPRAAIKTHTPNENDTIVPVNALPSRVTPEAIEQASATYRGRKPSGAMTALVVGDLNWGGGDDALGGRWARDRLIETIRKQAEAAEREIFLTTSPRTEAKDAVALIDALQPWIVDFYRYDLEKETSRQNPFLAWIGFVSRTPNSEVLLTADSLSMMSDMMTSGQPFRLIHDWQSYHRDWKPERAIQLSSQMPSPWRIAADQLLKTNRFTKKNRTRRLTNIAQTNDNTARMSHWLLQRGVPDLYDSPDVHPRPNIETGLHEAMQVIAHEVQRVYRQLNY